MKFSALLFILSLSMLSLKAQDAGSGGFAPSIPKGSLKDPLGNNYTSQGFLKKPVVLIFSVPSMAQGGNQKGWAKALGSDPATKLPNSVGFFLVENMKQAGMGSNMAREEMKKKYHVGDRPVLLLDEDGSESQRFGIPRNSTCVLIYSKQNKLVHVEKGPATSAAVGRVLKALSAIR